ncbi:hypothetical protein CEK25_008045 [Fusarium fujikuroi]|nr:hypothetical protein CEK25_008045 [Fusarium fujikuroi]
MNEANKNDLWDPFFWHLPARYAIPDFAIPSKTPTGIILNHFVDPLKSTPTCMDIERMLEILTVTAFAQDVDNLKIQCAELDEMRQVTQKVITFDGRKEATTAPTNGRFNSNWMHSSITSTGAAISGGILAAFLLATLLSATAEVANGALSGKLGRADFGSELESLAVGEAVAVFPGGSEVRKTLGSADGGASSGKGDEEEESGGELHYEKLRC